MGIRIDIEKTVASGTRRFSLTAAFSSNEDFVVLCGPSGSGKSLTLGCIAGTVSPDCGVVEVGGRVLFDSVKGIDLPIRERGIGYLFQDYALFPHLSVEKNIGFGLKKWWTSRPSEEERERVREVMGTFGLVGLAGSLPRDLSGGQRQRVALARALINRPRALLLDEPFAALDTVLRKKMRSELRAVQKGFGVPVVLVTHDPADVDAFAGAVVEYDAGVVRDVRLPERALQLPDYCPRYV